MLSIFILLVAFNEWRELNGFNIDVVNGICGNSAYGAWHQIDNNRYFFAWYEFIQRKNRPSTQSIISVDEGGWLSNNSTTQ